LVFSLFRATYRRFFCFGSGFADHGEAAARGSVEDKLSAGFLAATDAEGLDVFNVVFGDAENALVATRA
jgi:hypothetical protein